ncbi:hypothetical protein CUMW_161250 [Citrus unshiu]|uniref:Peptidase S26 domain-containing protein n=1 Tax=Citrus unshiu TaxID=55188 RepID=A0A2H5PRN7_CITUN|nr:hypothetical protein CUMW_161250 [Citrus unshiu]
MRRWGLLAKEALTQTLTFARFFCLFHVTNHYLWSPTLVFGPSMLPTLNLTGDVILAEYVSHRVGRVGPGDIVFVRSPVDPNKIVTKRIVGVEGDRVTFFKPRNGDTSQRGMFGYKGITFMLPGIRGNLGLFRMVLLKGKHFSGCGHLIALDHWDNERCNIVSMHLIRSSSKWRRAFS